MLKKAALLMAISFPVFAQQQAIIDPCTGIKDKLAKIDKEIQAKLAGCPQDPQRCMKIVDDLKAQKTSLQDQYVRNKCKSDPF